MARETVSLDRGWLFHRGEIEIRRPPSKGPIYSSAKTVRERWGPASVEYNDTSDDYRPGVEFDTDRWEKADLPHDYVIEGAFDPNENNALGYLKYENAWYRRHLTLTEEDRGKRITLFFEGVAGEAEVWFNGIPVARNSSGYTSFEVDITDFALFGRDNLIALHTDLSRHEGWWYEGGGIYRHVWLVKTPFVCVDRWGIRIVQKRIRDTLWRADAEITVKNMGYEDSEARVHAELLDPAGNPVSAADSVLSLPACCDGTASVSVYVDDPVLWQVGAGVLYTLRVTVTSEAGEDRDTAPLFP